MPSLFYSRCCLRPWKKSSNSCVPFLAYQRRPWLPLLLLRWVWPRQRLMSCEERGEREREREREKERTFIACSFCSRERERRWDWERGRQLAFTYSSKITIQWLLGWKWAQVVFEAHKRKCCWKLAVECMHRTETLLPVQCNQTLLPVQCNHPRLGPTQTRRESTRETVFFRQSSCTSEKERQRHQEKDM